MKSPDIFSCHLADLCHLINCMFVKSMFFTVCGALPCRCQSSMIETTAAMCKSSCFPRSYHLLIKTLVHFTADLVSKINEIPGETQDESLILPNNIFVVFLR